MVVFTFVKTILSLSVQINLNINKKYVPNTQNTFEI